MNEKSSKHQVEELEDLLRNQCYELDTKNITNTSLYSYRHINRLFKSKNGESIKSFFNRIKLQKSAEHLFYSSKSILEIAIEVGYESTSTFSKMFKKAYGISPSNFRKLNKQSTYLNSSDITFKSERLIPNNIRVKKICFDTEISFEDFYLLIKNTYQEIDNKNKDFMILWDEDPQMIKNQH